MSAYVVTKIVIKRMVHPVGSNIDLSWVVEQYGTDADATYADRTEALLRISAFDTFKHAVKCAYELAPEEGFPQPRPEPLNFQQSKVAT